MKIRDPKRRVAGFSFIEVLVVLAIMATLLLFAIPALWTMMRQAKLRGVARETQSLMRLARLDAIKYSSQGVVRIVEGDPDNGEPPTVQAFSDRDGDRIWDEGEPMLGRCELPTSVSFKSPGSDDFEDAVDGFTDDPEGGPELAVFLRDGSVPVEGGQGAFRFADNYDNFLEVRVATTAGRIEVLKWNDDEEDWFAEGDGERAWVWK
ncbi:MAG TPA: prepilin-type N-terminal cleavage/methylation domain-containing protein [Thermoanaerobaculia bacterium]|nr:prepilin-type N-terminal cleavage/methylation domain-containing protein [Thermoanaerobaculia bacterium]